MPEVIIKYKNAKALQALNDFAKYFDIVVKKSKSAKRLSKEVKEQMLPITFAENPDVTALAGIWENKNISLDDLRNNAWGNRS
jgi:hypothetical protein